VLARVAPVAARRERDLRGLGEALAEKRLQRRSLILLERFAEALDEEQRTVAVDRQALAALRRPVEDPVGVRTLGTEASDEVRARVDRALEEGEIYLNAATPVSSCPIASVWMSCVPS
jgi:hypothetical protein